MRTSSSHGVSRLGEYRRRQSHHSPYAPHALQILTQEDWHEVLYAGMAKTSTWTALYFILLMTFGNYVLFNLLVAILVEGFSAEAEASPHHIT